MPIKEQGTAWCGRNIDFAALAVAAVLHRCLTRILSFFCEQSIYWETPSVVGDAPTPRSGHSFTCIGDRFFVFGGCGRVNGKAQAFNDLKELDTQVD